MENSEYRVMYNLEQSYWWFLGKQFLVRQSLCGLGLESSKCPRLLDIGCGTGIILKILEEFGSAWGMELSLQALKFLREREVYKVVRGNANESLPFKDGTFSGITCLDVLEHLHNDSGLLRDMIRICKPGGRILITVPAFRFLWSPHDVALHHKRRYTRVQILHQAEGLGCKVIKATYFNTALFLPIMLLRKMRSHHSAGMRAQSDFFMGLPAPLNKILTRLYTLELQCLRHLNFPFGVSLLVILERRGSIEREPMMK